VPDARRGGAAGHGAVFRASGARGEVKWQGQVAGRLFELHPNLFELHPKC